MRRVASVLVGIAWVICVFSGFVIFATVGRSVDRRGRVLHHFDRNSRTGLYDSR